MTLQVIAMHGWAGDQRGWAAFAAAAAAQGWSWRNGERGYGGLPAGMPLWQPRSRRVVVVHSLGLHLLPPALLAQAEGVIVLASFGRFVPEGTAGRRLATALAGMARALEGDAADAMLRDFLIQAADPTPADPATLGIVDQPVAAAGRALLQADLAMLERTGGLPAAFPSGARVLLVEAGCDRIVVPEARQLLREALPDADLLHLAGAGHCLINPELVPMLIGWLQALA
ncbi:MAG: alpha/beta hydrolase [Cyanobacteriota bacterium]|nr:alpha/beta hydrolase [Cyanobacteriota bacterium]